MLDKDIRVLKGVGESRVKLFNKLGVFTVYDMLNYFPRVYEDRRQVKTIFEAVESETVCIKATVFSPVSERRVRNGLTIYSLPLCDDTGNITAVWFNNRFVVNRFKKGEIYTFYGKISRQGGKKQIENPVFEAADADGVTGKIVPLYPLTEGLTQRIVQAAMSAAMPAVTELDETIPHHIRSSYQLAELKFAMENIHFPVEFEDYEIARRRFVFEELLTLQLALLYLKSQQKVAHTLPMVDIGCIKAFTDTLPFPLTGAQSRVIAEIAHDIQGDIPMSRLVQGDVGSGKTVVAAAAMYAAVKNGFQAAMMAPTEILAEQHYNSFCKMLGDGCNIRLLTGSIPSAEKRQVVQDIADGTADIVIGTHAIIQEEVQYARLGMVVTDEQHRFGVKQRSAFMAKGNNPHVLVMSATPIPRTLALILYGDLDISIIDELPPGRKKIETYCVDEDMRARINAFMRKHITAGRQVYVVCPLVEESEGVIAAGADLSDVTKHAETLQKTFPDLNVALLHGKMKPKDKEAVMGRFKAGEIHILVSTTVIEVGVDVPNANIMVIENAERFGLNQLHQLRGRVGRGSEQSYCILFNQGDGEIAQKRMETMCESNDGFYISEQDLRLRGAGDFFGTRQHGLPPLKIANLFEDMPMLKFAQQAAGDIIAEDAALDSGEYAVLRGRMERLIGNVLL